MMIRSAYKIYSLLIFIFGFPLFAAVLLYLYPPSWFRLCSHAHGQFILKPFFFNQLEERVNLNSQQKWQLSYFTLKPCQQLCQESLKKLLNITLALGAQQSKVVVALWQPEEIEVPLLSKKIVIYRVSKQERARFFFEVLAEQKASGVYLSDPAQRIVLHYPEKGAAQDIYQDLRRLIK